MLVDERDEFFGKEAQERVGAARALAVRPDRQVVAVTVRVGHADDDERGDVGEIAQPLGGHDRLGQVVRDLLAVELEEHRISQRGAVIVGGDVNEELPVLAQDGRVKRPVRADGDGVAVLLGRGRTQGRDGQGRDQDAGTGRQKRWRVHRGCQS